jgi:GPH family glycoside/pentoside/hexuronide:cation symporter
MENEDAAEYKAGNKVAFGLGSSGDQIVYFSFTFLIFSFYYSVVKIDVVSVSLGFVIWSIWNAINDPLIGLISDKTNTKYGRRRPYMVVGFIPLCLMMIFLYTPPMTDFSLSFIYFLIVILLFDTLFTLVSLNQTAAFPEMWISEKERNSANNIRQVFTIVGLIIAFIVPTFMISNLTPTVPEIPQVLSEYQLAGVVLCVSAAICYAISILFGVKERREFSKDSFSTPNWGEAFRHTLGNRKFHWFLIANTCSWYVFGLIPTIVPLYGQFVLGIEKGETIKLGLLLAAAFISAAVFVNFWKALANKWKDLRKTWMVAMGIWAILLLGFFFVNDETLALILFTLNGIGLAGSLQLRDLVIADIIDEDEVRTGVRREGSYFGVNALIMRLSTIFVFLSIASVFQSTGWAVFNPLPGADTILGLRLLLAVFPAIALVIGVLAFSRFTLIGDELAEVKEKRDEIHRDKVAQV